MSGDARGSVQQAIARAFAFCKPSPQIQSGVFVVGCTLASQATSALLNQTGPNVGSEKWTLAVGAGAFVISRPVVIFAGRITIFKILEKLRLVDAETYVDVRAAATKAYKKRILKDSDESLIPRETVA